MTTLRDDFRAAIPPAPSEEEASDDFRDVLLRVEHERSAFRPVVAACAAAFLLFVLIVANQRPASSVRGNKYKRDMDKGQQMTYGTMQQLKREAQFAVADGRNDWNGAFERYGKIIAFADSDGMKYSRDAQILRQEANDSITAIHEALVIQSLAKATSVGEMNAEERADRIAKDLRIGRDSMDRGKRAAVSWRVAINAYSDLLTLDPENAEALRNLPIAEAENRKFNAANAAMSQDELEKRCVAQMGVAQNFQRTGQPASMQRAVTEYGKVVSLDPDGRTPYPATAQKEVAAIKKKLGDLASPLRTEALALQKKQDWRNARVAIRKAEAINPFDVNLSEIYDAIEKENLRSASHAMQEAKVYFGAEDLKNAKASAEQALTYADQDTDKEHVSATEILKKIQRAQEQNGNR